MQIYCALMGLFLLCLPLSVEAASQTVTWDPYTPPTDFKEFRWFRANQNCSAQGPLAPLMINGVQATTVKNAQGVLPTTFTDTTVPAMDGTLCYEVVAVDTSNNVSPVSNRASKVLDTNPPSALTGLRFQ